jgi:uncharacterized membrane protein YfcA
MPMDSILKIRFLLAMILSPMLVPLIIYTTFRFIFGGDVDQDKEIQTSISTAAWLSYGLALAFGSASYFWLRRKDWWSVWRYLIMGVASGFASWVLFSIISQTFVSLLFYVFLFAGMVMAGGFWLLAYFKPDGNHLIASSTSGRRRRRRAN